MGRDTIRPDAAVATGQSSGRAPPAPFRGQETPNLPGAELSDVGGMAREEPDLAVVVAGDDDRRGVPGEDLVLRGHEGDPQGLAHDSASIFLAASTTSSMAPTM